MIALQLPEVKDFMSKLLAGDVFDHFLLNEATITTYNTFTIDGHIKKPFYSQEELEELPFDEKMLSYWKDVKPFCFELIKGKKTPLSFHFVFQLSSQNVTKLLSMNNSSLSSKDLNGLYLNIRYDGSSLSLITGTSINIFTLDKSLDHIWDQMVQQFLKQKEIIFISTLD